MAALASLAATAAGIAAPAPEQIEQGKYIFHAAGCETCHTDEKHGGARLAGGRALATPFGTFYSPNITPDPTHGIGRWSDADFLRALRAGLSPRDEPYYPAFPYTSYTKLRDEDILALKAYLFSLPPVAQPNRPHRLSWYLRVRTSLHLWRVLFFTPGPFQPSSDRSDIWNRGAYLATAATHCGECHTPRNFLGGFKRGRYYAGNPQGPEDAVIPNITPDKKTGIGRWRMSELAYYFETGATPEGDYAGGLMADVIDHSLRHLTPPDRAALAAYVVSLPPIEQAAPKKKKSQTKNKELEY